MKAVKREEKCCYLHFQGFFSWTSASLILKSSRDDAETVEESSRVELQHGNKVSQDNSLIDVNVNLLFIVCPLQFSRPQFTPLVLELSHIQSHFIWGEFSILHTLLQL